MPDAVVVGGWHGLDNHNAPRIERGDLSDNLTSFGEHGFFGERAIIAGPVRVFMSRLVVAGWLEQAKLERPIAKKTGRVRPGPIFFATEEGP